MPFIIDYTKALKRISIVLAILSLLLAILPMPVVAHGAEHVEEDQHTEQTKYVYITEQGDNLTLLVRKSLKLYSNLT